MWAVTAKNPAKSDGYANDIAQETNLHSRLTLNHKISQSSAISKINRNLEEFWIPHATAIEENVQRTWYVFTHMPKQLMI